MRFFDFTAAAFFCLPVALAQIPRIRGYDLIWADDFTGNRNTLPHPNNWIIDVGTSYPGGPPSWGTGEVQTYTNSPNNIRVDGRGNLQIAALRDAAGGWTSSRIETKRTFMAQPGGKMRIEASLKIPGLGSRGIGYWAAFWTLGAEYRGNYTNWPSVGEIDIMENVNTLNRVWGVLHCGTNPGGVCNEPSGISSNLTCPAFGPCPGNSYRYALEVDRTRSPETISWFVNGNMYHQVNQGQLPNDTWTQVAQKPHFILLNLAMGGAFPDAIYGSKTPIPATASGGTFEAQYVAVYNTR